MTKEELVIRAARAKGLASDPILAEVLSGIEADVVSLWRDAVSVDVRERCHAELHALDRFKAKLQSLIDAGFVAEAPKPADPV